MADGFAVFAYGTLLFPENMEAVTGCRFEAVPATLSGYRRRRIEDRTYPGIASAPGESIDGRLYQDVDEGTLARLDIFEGDLYERQRLCVSTAARNQAEAWGYVVRPRYVHRLSSHAWDPEDFLLEHGEAFLEVCKRFRRDGVA